MGPHNKSIKRKESFDNNVIGGVYLEQLYICMIYDIYMYMICYNNTP